VRIGFIPLADCAPLLVARELDIFRKHGVRVELSCEVGWATIREKLLYNQIDAAHAIAGLALAMRMGLSTSPSRVVAPFIFNLHGNAITLSRDLWNRGVRDAVTLKKLIRSSRSRRFTFAMVSRYSSHFFLLRRWLTEGGIHLEREVRLVVLPPTQMATNLAANLIDGYCVGEPWNSTAVENGTGWIAATSEQLAPNHPEKVLLMNESFIVQYADQALAITEALRESCAFCDPMENRPEVVRVLTNSGHFNGFEKALSRSLIGPFDLGTGSTIDAANFHIFQRRNANEPLNERGTWLLNEFITHGLIQPGQRAEATEALSACWTAEPLRSAPASPALPSTQTTVPKTKKLATPATV
jgi:NitT/TauT family transport system ATP-binding protein